MQQNSNPGSSPQDASSAEHTDQKAYRRQVQAQRRDQAALKATLTHAQQANQPFALLGTQGMLTDHILLTPRGYRHELPEPLLKPEMGIRTEAEAWYGARAYHRIPLTDTLVILPAFSPQAVVNFDEEDRPDPTGKAEEQNGEPAAESPRSESSQVQAQAFSDAEHPQALLTLLQHNPHIHSLHMDHTIFTVPTRVRATETVNEAQAATGADDGADDLDGSIDGITLHYQVEMQPIDVQDDYIPKLFEATPHLRCLSLRQFNPQDDDAERFYQWIRQKLEQGNVTLTSVVTGNQRLNSQIADLLTPNRELRALLDALYEAMNIDEQFYQRDADQRSLVDMSNDELAPAKVAIEKIMAYTSSLHKRFSDPQSQQIQRELEPLTVLLEALELLNRQSLKASDQQTLKARVLKFIEHSFHWRMEQLNGGEINWRQRQQAFPAGMAYVIAQLLSKPLRHMQQAHSAYVPLLSQLNSAQATRKTVWLLTMLRRQDPQVAQSIDALSTQVTQNILRESHLNLIWQGTLDLKFEQRLYFNYLLELAIRLPISAEASRVLRGHSTVQVWLTKMFRNNKTINTKSLIRLQNYVAKHFVSATRVPNTLLHALGMRLEAFQQLKHAKEFDRLCLSSDRHLQNWAAAQVQRACNGLLNYAAPADIKFIERRITASPSRTALVADMASYPPYSRRAVMHTFEARLSADIEKLYTNVRDAILNAISAYGEHQAKQSVNLRHRSSGRLKKTRAMLKAIDTAAQAQHISPMQKLYLVQAVLQLIFAHSLPERAQHYHLLYQLYAQTQRTTRAPALFTPVQTEPSDSHAQTASAAREATPELLQAFQVASIPALQAAIGGFNSDSGVKPHSWHTLIRTGKPNTRTGLSGLFGEVSYADAHTRAVEMKQASGRRRARNIKPHELAHARHVILLERLERRIVRLEVRDGLKNAAEVQTAGGQTAGGQTTTHSVHARGRGYAHRHLGAGQPTSPLISDYPLIESSSDAPYYH